MFGQGEELRCRKVFKRQISGIAATLLHKVTRTNKKMSILLSQFSRKGLLFLRQVINSPTLEKKKNTQHFFHHTGRFFTGLKKVRRLGLDKKYLSEMCITILITSTFDSILVTTVLCFCFSKTSNVWFYLKVSFNCVIIIICGS